MKHVIVCTCPSGLHLEVVRHTRPTQADMNRALQQARDTYNLNFARVRTYQAKDPLPGMYTRGGHLLCMALPRCLKFAGLRCSFCGESICRDCATDATEEQRQRAGAPRGWRGYYCNACKEAA